MTKQRNRPAELLPLKAEVFEILMRLMQSDCHGYAIMRDVAQSTGGAVDMLPGTLYRHLRWMLDRELIAEVGRRTTAGGDQRRKVYRATPRGRRATRLEAARLEDRVAVARAHKLIPEARS